MKPILRFHKDAALAQIYHPGPYEAGIFYYRYPDEQTGTIFSITDKIFPRVVGDGVSTLETLIWCHPRLRMQADVFLARYKQQLDAITEADQPFELAVAGNHCQGTMFKDGSHLITVALTRTIDTIARQFDGFYFGRFDVRYGDVDALENGRDFTIIELNGATSESTNIYDPSWSLWAAYRTFGRQWSILYRIGDRNRCNGHPTERFWPLVRSVASYYRRRRVDPIAD